jgi:hypothetical protein
LLTFLYSLNLLYTSSNPLASNQHGRWKVGLTTNTQSCRTLFTNPVNCPREHCITYAFADTAHGPSAHTSSLNIKYLNDEQKKNFILGNLRVAPACGKAYSTEATARFHGENATISVPSARLTIGMTNCRWGCEDINTTNNKPSKATSSNLAKVVLSFLPLTSSTAPQYTDGRNSYGKVDAYPVRI